jgi:hypothetical protein
MHNPDRIIALTEVVDELTQQVDEIERKTIYLDAYSKTASLEVEVKGMRPQPVEIIEYEC